MKTMLLFSLTAALALATQAMAADKSADPSAKPKAAQKVMELAVELDLTADQKAKVRTALQEQKQQLKAVREDASLGKAEKAAKLRAQQNSLAASLKDILTEEQYAKWEKARDEAQAEKKTQRKQNR